MSITPEEKQTAEATDRFNPVDYIQDAIASGEHWYVALLKAMARWSPAKETYDGRQYRYLIDGEAFDWLLLAERLCEAVDGVVPQGEKEALLFQACPPLELSEQEFKELIGPAKYQTYLNYFYGVTVEEALLLAVEEEVRKEWIGLWRRESAVEEEADWRLYGAARDSLLIQFREEKGYPQEMNMDFARLKEFTYWLFKRRLRVSDKARFASDVKKGLGELQRQWRQRRPTTKPHPPEKEELLPTL